MTFAGDFIPQTTDFMWPCVSDGWLVANLEGAVCAADLSGAPKVGVRLRCAPFTPRGRMAVVLANNHVMDFGAEGLSATRDFLAAKGIPCAGAGTTRDAARQAMVLEESGRKIAVLSCCERQFGVASETTPGVADMGPWLYAAIAAAKASADFVVVSCHCASEYSTAASPRLQAFYRSLVDAGADVVHGHHAHVPQGWETYRGRPIFYGLGNFVVAREPWQATPNALWSLVAHVDFGGDAPSWRVEPVGEVPADVESYLKRANLGFARPELMNALWQESCVTLYHRLYEQSVRAPSVVSRELSWRDRLRKLYFATADVGRALLGREAVTVRSRQRGRVFYHYFACESHVDVIETALGVLTGSTTDERGRLEGI